MNLKQMEQFDSSVEESSKWKRVPSLDLFRSDLADTLCEVEVEKFVLILKVSI